MDKNKANICREILNKMISENKEELIKNAIDMQVGSGSYGDSNVNFKLSCSDISSDGTIENAMRSDYRRSCRGFLLEPEWLDKSFLLGTTEYKIIGLKTRSSKYPVVCTKKSDGENYKLPADSVILGMERAKQEVPTKKPTKKKSKKPAGIDISNLVNKAIKEAD